MGTPTTNNQLANFFRYECLRGKSFLELGFIQQENLLDLKKICMEQEAFFYRTNIEDSKNIDFVWDLHKPLPQDYPIKNFDYVICSSVMEHVEKPWIAAENIEKIIKPNGKLLWTTPWVWKMHGYPNDYWRYTPNAVKQLFDHIDWSFEGFELIFDGFNKSILFDWEAGMENHVFEFTKDSFEKLQPTIDYKYYKTLSSFSKKKLTLASKTDSQVFKTEKFTLDTYSTLISGKSITMLPMCNLFMIGNRVSDSSSSLNK